MAATLAPGCSHCLAQSIHTRKKPPEQPLLGPFCLPNSTLLTASARLDLRPQPKFRTAKRSSLGRRSPQITARHSDLDTEQPPRSREEAIGQARTALSVALGKAIAKKGKKSDRIRQQLRVRVEVPVLDDSASSTITLLEDVFSTVLKDDPAAAALYFGNPEAANLASDNLLKIEGLSKYYVYSIKDQIRVPADTSVVVVVGPTEEQISALQDIVGTAGSRPTVVLNPEWDDEADREPGKRGFVSSFDVCYSYLPLRVQGLLSQAEGAILKYAKGGQPSAAQWQFFVKTGDSFNRVRATKKRPTAKDIEDVFYNWFAANSPVNKSIGFVRKLVTRGKG